VDTQLVEMAAQLHAIASNSFGYIQCGQYDTWYDAIHAFVDRLLPISQKKRRSKRGERLLRLIERIRMCWYPSRAAWSTLTSGPQTSSCVAKATLSIFPGSIRSGASGRSYAGFRLFYVHHPLRDKAELLAAYNAASPRPVSLSREEEIRFAIGQAYLALIMETEKYYRYTLLNFGWWRNVFACRLLYRAAFTALEK
jgi:hypothetical protein